MLVDINSELPLEGVLCLRLHLICRGKLRFSKSCFHLYPLYQILKVLDFWRD